MRCAVCYDRQMAGSEWLEKKFIEQMLTEPLSDEDVRLLVLLALINYSQFPLVKT